MSAEKLKASGPIWAFCGVLVGAGISWFTFHYGQYSETVRNQRQELASDLAAYYSEAAAEYYAQTTFTTVQDNQHIDRQSPYYLQIEKEQDIHYAAFLSATTKLAAEVPPDLRERVLALEDNFEKIPDHPTPKYEKKYFDDLDELRFEILQRTKFDASLSPVWKLSK